MSPNWLPTYAGWVRGRRTAWAHPACAFAWSAHLRLGSANAALSTLSADLRCSHAASGPPHSIPGTPLWRGIWPRYYDIHADRTFARTVAAMKSNSAAGYYRHGSSRPRCWPTRRCGQFGNAQRHAAGLSQPLDPEPASLSGNGSTLRRGIRPGLRITKASSRGRSKRPMAVFVGRITRQSESSI